MCAASKRRRAFSEIAASRCRDADAALPVRSCAQRTAVTDERADGGRGTRERCSRFVCPRVCRPSPTILRQTGGGWMISKSVFLQRRSCSHCEHNRRCGFEFNALVSSVCVCCAPCATSSAINHSVNWVFIWTRITFLQLHSGRSVVFVVPSSRKVACTTYTIGVVFSSDDWVECGRSTSNSSK